MPIFEYICLDCKSSFELMTLKQNGEADVCSSCGSEKVEKQLSSFSAISSPSTSGGGCDPTGCQMPSGPGGMPPCAGGGCQMG
ncbi:MAG: zinc ribbon domain-containing protein [Nitrospinota bacterium]